MDLTPDFTRAQTAYADRLAYATACRHKEVWSKGPLLHAEPFDFERLGVAPGRMLRKQPAATQNTYCYWLNEQHVLLAIRKGTTLANQFYEEFFYLEDGCSKSCLYGNTHLLQNVKTRLVKDGRISEVFLLGGRGSKHETFQYAGDKLVRIRVEQESAGQAGISYTTLFTYQSDHLHEIVTEFDNGYRVLNYQATR
jgi:hypothetical protein